MVSKFDEIAKYIPEYSHSLQAVPIRIKDKATDIRLSVGNVPMVLMGSERYRLESCPIISKNDMQNIIFSLCDSSVYKHMEEIKNGYISVKNHFRAGICGTAVIKNDKIENIQDIKSIFIRVPRFVEGSALKLQNELPSFEKGVLIVGEPSSGKTTLLRDIMQMLKQKRLVVLDERYELTGGFTYTDLDILYSYPKAEGINHAIRNLGAKIIICDEIEEKDILSVENSSSSGVSLIATVHGTFEKSLRTLIKKLLYTNAFSYIVELQGRENPCGIKKIWVKDELLKNFGCDTH